ncbi:sex peptide receptor-like [Babylonia areolata]|uniref:sex peptide receptor-like n=1 Tax=Babylonia areolata TaxID=304850 RepID=UPI003FCF8F49
MTSLYDDAPVTYIPLYGSEGDYDGEAGRMCGQRGSWLHLTVKPIVYSVGIVGIVLTVVVLSRKTMCTSTNCYLTALAVADLMVLLLLSVIMVTEHVGSCYRHLEDFFFAFFQINTILLNMALFASVWITVLLAVERYIAICHPMKAMLICTTRRARYLIGLIFLLALVVRFPNFLDMALVEKRLYRADNSTYSKVVLEWRQEDAYNNTVYSIIVPGIMAGLLPLLALAVLNTRLVVEIRNSTRYLRYHLAIDSRIQSIISHEEKKITLMLIFIVIAFFIFQCPYMVYTFITALGDYSFKLLPLEQLQPVHDVALIVLAVKSSCNFILYCWFSEKFWTTFKQIFCLRHCLPEQPALRNGLAVNGHHCSARNTHRTSCFVTRETTC